MTDETAKATPQYTEYHPRWYRRRVSTYWWLGRWPYLRFILRELSSLAVAFFVVLTLTQIYALGQGAQVYAELQEWLRQPAVIALNAVVLLFAVFHTLTWFNAAPKAMAVRLGGKRVPEWAVAAPNYAAWIAASAVVAWFLLER
jgi:fumarate reductase subunit C